MKYASRRRRYAPPVLESLTYERARAKVQSVERRADIAEHFPVVALECLLISFPLMVVLSVVDPSRMLMSRVLLRPSPLVWIAWALVCFSLSLSSEEFFKRVSPRSKMRGNGALFLLLGLGNCLGVVGLLWMAGA